MIEITDKHNCCGCSACVQICPKQCIKLEEDSEGFLYPKVNQDSCSNCGLCEKVCPIISPYDKRIPIKIAAAQNNNEEIRYKSSSGGLFTILAEFVIEKGGVVFGAKYDFNWEVYLDYTETIDGLSDFRGSKYLQARTENSFKQCKNFLQQGRLVMFSGTPCQIAGLKHFLRKEYDNLLTIDFVCHGVPSPKVWRKYLQTKIDEFAKIHKVNSQDIQITNTSFRDKIESWRRFHLTFNYVVKSNGINSQGNESKSMSCDYYMQAFLKNMILRPSCYNCQSKECKSNSDITIGDYWGIQNVNIKMDDNKGTSLILFHNKKAEDFLYSNKIEICYTTYEEALKGNPAIVKSAEPWFRRELFFAELDNNKNVSVLIKKMLRPTITTFLKEAIMYPLGKVRGLILKIKRIITK